LRAEGAHPAIPAAVVDVLGDEPGREAWVAEHELHERVHDDRS
jgi:hypothetical protein